MYPLRLLRLAAQAESVRYRALGRRLAVRAVVFGLAAIFLLTALIFAHIAAWFWLRDSRDLAPLSASGLIAGADLVIAVILAWSAAHSRPGAVEAEAIAIRRQAVIGLRSQATLATAAMPLLRVLIKAMNRKAAEPPAARKRPS